MRTIGGFHELLLPERAVDYHKDALALTNGRACIRVLINNLNIKKCYIPNYTCDTIYQPFELENISYELYNINESMEPASLPDLAPNEYFYYINYFGMKGDVLKKLHAFYGDKLIIDNVHDFFRKRQFNCWSFTSARKYFGVPDGAFLYAPKPINNNFERFNKFSLTHSVERLKGNQSVAFAHYQEYEKSLDSDIKKISLLSERMLSLVNIKDVASRRRENFDTLDKILGGNNTFALKGFGEDDVPFAYPFLPAGSYPKESLYDVGIFVPTLWADPLKRPMTTPFEKRLAETLMPLPIDERYNVNDMKFMAEKILGDLR